MKREKAFYHHSAMEDALALTQISIPANAQKISVSFVVGEMDHSSCSFYLWSVDKTSTTTVGTSGNSTGTFTFADTPTNLRNRIVEWDFTLYSDTGAADEQFCVTVLFMADGVPIGSPFIDKNTITDDVKIRDACLLV